MQTRKGKSRLRVSRETLTLLVLLLLILPACRSALHQNNHESPEIIVAAAANLTDAFEELKQEFTKESGIRVLLSFGSTADLAKQIENGAPFDVFAAADVAHVDALDRKGLLTPGTRAVYARGSLVIWVPHESRIVVDRPEDLTSKDVERVAIAKPDIAPYGEAAVESLRSLKLWEQIEPKVVYGMNVSQVKQFVSSGNAEVGFLPRALVKPTEGRAIEIDESLHRPIDQALGVVKGSTNQDAARRFTVFVLSPAGQALLSKYGYHKPASIQ